MRGLSLCSELPSPTNRDELNFARIVVPSSDGAQFYQLPSVSDTVPVLRGRAPHKHFFSATSTTIFSRMLAVSVYENVFSATTM